MRIETKELMDWLSKYPYVKLDIHTQRALDKDETETRIIFINTNENGDLIQPLYPIYYKFSKPNNPLTRKD